MAKSALKIRANSVPIKEMKSTFPGVLRGRTQSVSYFLQEVDQNIQSQIGSRWRLLQHRSIVNVSNLSSWLTPPHSNNTDGIKQRSSFRTAVSHPGFVVVPQQAAFIIERLGKFKQVLKPGFHFLIPLIDRVAYVHSLKEEAINVANQSAITRDNVTIQLDGVLYIKIESPYDASYGVENPIYSVTQLAQTTMRSELGKLTLDETFLERETLNQAITTALNAAASSWGIRCMRYEIRDIVVPANIRNAMERQAEAERRKRAEILQSEGERESAINLSQGKKQAVILQAQGEAEAVIRRAEATATGLKLVSQAIESSGGKNAVAMQLAEQYMEAFGRLAKEANTVIIPANPNDVAGMLTQALAVYKSVNCSGGGEKKTDGEKQNETATTRATENVASPTSHQVSAPNNISVASEETKGPITKGNEEQASGNLLMVSNQKHRSFYERAARELLASGHQEIQLSALGNAVSQAVAVALLLQEKNAVTIKKIETKHVEFTPVESRRRHPAPTTIHSSGMSIFLQRFPNFKGTRIVPNFVYFCPKPTRNEYLAYHESPDMCFVSVNSGPIDKLLTSAYGESLMSVLKEVGYNDLDTHKKLREHLFEEAEKANQGINDLKAIKFVGELSAIKTYNPNLKAAFVRVPPQANRDHMTGSAFIEVFDGKYPHNSENNAAVLHLISPRGTSYARAEEFLSAVKLAATNLMTALCDFNGYSRRHSGSPRLKKLAVARLGLFSSEPDMIHPKTTKTDVAKAILQGLELGYHFGTAPRLQFLYDDDEIMKKVWLDESGTEGVQISESSFRRRNSGERRQSERFSPYANANSSS